VEATKNVKDFTITTQNVRALRLRLPEDVGRPVVLSIDKQEMKVQPYDSALGPPTLYLERRDNAWHSVLPQKLAAGRLRHLQKITGLHGPIDDAFMDGFVCVRGTGKPHHPSVQRYADAALERFQREWDKYLRGKLPVKDDIEITEEDLARKNLILFGDPGSNSLIAQMLDSVPLTWTPRAITLADGNTGTGPGGPDRAIAAGDGRAFAAGEHVPILIYPSPFNTGRYVVINSGHTFHAADFHGTNALLYPRLGDYAVLKLTPSAKEPLAAEVVAAGLFDDNWRFRH
jgi:hypothetical protein